MGKNIRKIQQMLTGEFGKKKKVYLNRLKKLQNQFK